MAARGERRAWVTYLRVSTPEQADRDPHDSRFVLKGALLLRAWGAPVSRPTRDIDFLGYVQNDIGVVEKIMREVCEASVEDDGLVFDGASVQGQRIKEDADYHGVRITFTGLLDRARIPMKLDIGFGDVVHPEAEQRDYPTLLDLPAPRCRPRISVREDVWPQGNDPRCQPCRADGEVHRSGDNPTAVVCVRETVASRRDSADIRRAARALAAVPASGGRRAIGRSTVQRAVDCTWTLAGVG